MCLRHRSVEAKLKTFCRYVLSCIYFIFIPIIKLVTNYNMFNELLLHHTNFKNFFDWLIIKICFIQIDVHKYNYCKRNIFLPFKVLISSSGNMREFNLSHHKVNLKRRFSCVFLFKFCLWQAVYSEYKFIFYLIINIFKCAISDKSSFIPILIGYKWAM